MLFDLFAIAIIVAVAIGATFYLGIGRTPSDPRVETPEMWRKILGDCVLLGIEMGRADGHLTESELEALKSISTIANGVIGDADSEAAISAVMKATIHRDRIKAAARRIRKRAPRDVRIRLLGYLRSVSLADGDWDEEEKALLSWVCEIWGCEQADVLQTLGLDC